MSNEEIDSTPTFEFDQTSNRAVDEEQLVEEQENQVAPKRNRGRKRGGKAASIGGRKVRKRAKTDNQIAIKGVGKRTSTVWNEFTIVPYKNKETGEVFLLHAVCKHCKGTWYRAEGMYGTSNCKRHLTTCEIYIEWYENHGDKGEFNQIQYCKLFAEAIFLHGYPLSIVEHEGIRKLHVYLNPKVTPISRTTITRWCMKKHDKMKEMLFRTLSSLSSKVCLTCDIWTACTSRAYLTLTAHYIDDDWILKAKVLNFRHFPPPHSGLEIYKLIYGMIKDWGLEKKILTMTIDNASSMDSMVSKLQSTLNSHVPLPFSVKYFHVRCSTHILNLIVKEGLKVIDNSVNLVRENVKYIDPSEARMNRFRECVSDPNMPSSLKLWLDVPTRWNSTYLMLARALEYESALTLFGETELSYPFCLSPLDWNAVVKMCTLLQPFYEITNMFSGSDYPTANLYIEQVIKIDFHLRRACESEDDNIRQMENLMFDKFDKYWSESSLILSLAAIFDPRHKLQCLRHNLKYVYQDEEHISKQIQKVKSELLQLYNSYKGSVEFNHENSSSYLSRLMRRSDDEFESFDSIRAATHTVSEKSEVEVYLSMPLLNAGSNGDSKFEILRYWKEQASNFPIISRIAKEILAILITAVASESTFSMGGRILNRWRASLLSRHVEALVTTRNWLFGYEEPDEDGVIVEKEPGPDVESHANEDDAPSLSS